MKHSITILLMGASLMFSGCQKEEPLAPGPMKGVPSTSTTTGAEQLQPITDITWALSRLSDDRPLEPDRDGPWFRLDSRTARLDGHTGCNELNGQYEIAESHIDVAEIVQTRIYCAAIDDLESRYVDALNKADNYQLNGRTLVLYHGPTPLAWFEQQ